MNLGANAAHGVHRARYAPLHVAGTALGLLGSSATFALCQEQNFAAASPGSHSLRTEGQYVEGRAPEIDGWEGYKSLDVILTAQEARARLEAEVAFEALDGFAGGPLYGAGLSGEVWRRNDDS